MATDEHETDEHETDAPGHAGAVAHHATDDHGDDHGHDDHAHAEEALGPVDGPAWGAGDPWGPAGAGCRRRLRPRDVAGLMATPAGRAVSGPSSA